MMRTTKIGIWLVIVGLTAPHIIDAIETVRHLDINRDFGVLPWLIMTIVGVVFVLRSVSNHLRHKSPRTEISTSREDDPYHHARGG